MLPTAAKAIQQTHMVKYTHTQLVNATLQLGLRPSFSHCYIWFRSICYAIAYFAIF